MTLSMYRKWRARRRAPLLLMTIVFITFTSALIVLLVGLLDSAIVDYFRELYRLTLPVAYALTILVDIILFRFTAAITGRKLGAFKHVILIGLVICVMLFLPWNWWGTPKVDYTGKLNIRVYSMACLITFSFVIYIKLALVCYRASIATASKVSKMGLHLIVWSMVLMTGFFLMFTFDTILIVYFNHAGYSVFVYIAWIFAILFYILMYVAVVMPEWLTTRLSRKK